MFRVASTPESGGGDMMRCLSIGRELHKFQSVHFLLCKGGEYWIDRIKHYGMTASVYKLPEEIKNKNLLVDGYYFSNLEVKVWRKQCRYMAFIDDADTAPKSKYADMIIYTHLNSIHNNKNQIKLQGNKYALLSPEYANFFFNHSLKEVRNILISCGLLDSNNYTGQVLESLSKTDFDGNVNIAIGDYAPCLHKLLNSINNYNFSVNIILNSNGLYDLLLQSNMVIGTGGVSLLERMALGKPSVTIVAAENQRSQAKWAENAGATILVDPAKQKFKHDINSAIDFLLKSEEKRLEMSGKGISIIDGKGSDRVARCMAFGEC